MRLTRKSDSRAATGDGHYERGGLFGLGDVELPTAKASPDDATPPAASPEPAIAAAATPVATTTFRRALIRSKCSDVCPGCACFKKAGDSFCGRCYFGLPVPMRQALYRRIGRGYEEAFAKACAVLGGALPLSPADRVSAEVRP